jgi:hypothetical protein
VVLDEMPEGALRVLPPRAVGSFRGTITDDHIRELEQRGSKVQPSSNEQPGEATG